MKELQDIIVTLREELAQLQDAFKSCQSANVEKKSYADATVSHKQGTTPTPRLRENVSGDFALLLQVVTIIFPLSLQHPVCHNRTTQSQ